jgi:hypothetical protein
MGAQNSAAADEPVGLSWRKSSATGDANCVEAAFAGERVLVRDSKDRTRTIGLSRGAWRGLLAGVEEAADQ